MRKGSQWGEPHDCTAHCLSGSCLSTRQHGSAVFSTLSTRVFYLYLKAKVELLHMMFSCKEQSMNNQRREIPGWFIRLPPKKLTYSISLIVLEWEEREKEIGEGKLENGE